MKKYKFISFGFIFWGGIFSLVLFSSFFILLTCIIILSYKENETIIYAVYFDIFLLLSILFFIFTIQKQEVFSKVEINEKGAIKRILFKMPKQLKWEEMVEVGIGHSESTSGPVGHIYFADKKGDYKDYHLNYRYVRPKKGSKDIIISITLRKGVLEAVQEFYKGEIRGLEDYKKSNPFSRLVK
jgi:hypothetical protein